MDYGEYTLETVIDRFRLRPKMGTVPPVIAPIKPPDWLQEALSVARSRPAWGDRARVEFLVAPLLLAARHLTHTGLYSGLALEADPQDGPAGTCDYLFTRADPLPSVTPPVLAVVAYSPRDDTEAALGVCAAQMLAAQRLNRRVDLGGPAVYGCVTTGGVWRFLCLEGDALTFSRNHLYITQSKRILGTFATILTPAATGATGGAGAAGSA